MRVLGVDPGSRNTGLGVVEADAKGLHCIDWRCIRMREAGLPERLGRIYREVSALIEQTQPQVLAVEQVFVANNARSALTLGQARGGAICAGVNAGLPVAEYSALQIKRAVVGGGRADKQQVQHMVGVLLSLRDKPGFDAADALACAICHIHTAQAEKIMQRTQAREAPRKPAAARRAPA